jgi:hypothetical protein
MWQLILGFGGGLFAALIAIWCTFRLISTKNARNVPASDQLPPTPLKQLSGRLSECEQLLQEVLQHLGRIEARDRMRKVRAAKDLPQPEPEPENVALTTAELRRKLAIRKTGVT